MELHATKRKRSGNQNNSLRRDGFIPAVVFSKKFSVNKEKPVNIKLELAEFNSVFEVAGESTIITLNIEGEKPKKVLISDVQRDPLTFEIIHASLFEIDMTEKITATVPIEIVGEEDSEAVKSGEGLIIKVLDEIEVECLPMDLPKSFKVDASQLKEVGETLTVQQAINVNSEKIQLNVNPEEIILKVDYAEQLEVEEPEEEQSVEEVEVLKEKGEEEQVEDSSEKSEPAAENDSDTE